LSQVDNSIIGGTLDLQQSVGILCKSKDIYRIGLALVNPRKSGGPNLRKLENPLNIFDFEAILRREHIFISGLWISADFHGNINFRNFRRPIRQFERLPFE
jgi:hypothetical protein